MTQPAKSSHEITELLREWSEGDREALDELLPLVYDELHRQAARYRRRERPDHTLQTTALIHEAYLKLIDQRDVKWQSRAHFFAIASLAMRRVLVNYAKARHREKRGGDDVKVALEEGVLAEEDGLAVGDESRVEIIALDEALTRLAEVDKQQARVVELRYFSGLSLEEVAEVLAISRATVARDWNMAKAWLHQELTR
jgi:RNA polymerase sigma factor (TIGR02999 family)